MEHLYIHRLQHQKKEIHNKKNLFLLLLLCGTITINAEIYTLSGCKFISYEMRAVELNFYDQEHCECTQYFRIPLPNDNYCKKDTLIYRIDGYEISLFNLQTTSDHETEFKKIQDYYSMAFNFPLYVLRDGHRLTEYPIPGKIQIHSSVAGEAQWIYWGYKTVGILDFQDVIFICGAACYLVEGIPNMPTYRKNDELPKFECECQGLAFPCYDEVLYKNTIEYKWLTRARNTSSTDSTKKELINRQFIYSSDTLFFKGDSMCVVHGKSINRICRYVINGVNVLLYGLDISNPSKVDTLIYSNHVLFYSFVKQTKTEPDTMRSSKSFIGPNLPVEYHYPTATMQTYAFVQANMTVTDEQIGTTFQSVYMPINFHGVTSQIGRAICDSSPQ